jgi:hypothetical protein
MGTSVGQQITSMPSKRVKMIKRGLRNLKKNLQETVKAQISVLQLWALMEMSKIKI